MKKKLQIQSLRLLLFYVALSVGVSHCTHILVPEGACELGSGFGGVAFGVWLPQGRSGFRSPPCHEAWSVIFSHPNLPYKVVVKSTGWGHGVKRTHICHFELFGGRPGE